MLIEDDFAPALTILLTENVIYKRCFCFQSLRNPLRLKYSCSSQSTWKLAVDSLMTVVRRGLNVALARPGTKFHNMQCMWLG